MADAFAALEISAQNYLDSERRDPGSDIARLLRDTADQVADEERVFVPKRTGATLASIHTEDAYDDDGFFEVHVASERLTTNVLNSEKGYIDNPRSKNPAKWTRKVSVRPAHPFARDALWSVTKIEGV